MRAELQALYAKRPNVIKPGLSRIEAALSVLGKDKLLAAPSVLIGGTNGKGTTAGFLFQMLAGLGVKTGLFTSPHLVHFAERIQVSGETTHDDLLVAELAGLRRELPADVYEPLSFFEVNTLLAFRVFRRLGVQMDVLEVGLGGRWDSTNVARPTLSIITSIGMDHMDLLGDTPAKIAFEKAGIMRPGTPVLWGGDGAGEPSAIAVLRREAAARQAPFWELGREFGTTPDGAWVRLPGHAPFAAALPGAWLAWPGFLRENWLKALAAFVYLAPEIRGRTTEPGLALKAVDEGRVPVPASLRGRFEAATVAGRKLLLDVCHNVDGARALVRGLRETGALAKGLPTGLVSILADKDCDAVLDVLRPALSPLKLFAVHSERTWTPARLAERHRDLPFFSSFADAFAAPAPGLTVICGSVYAVGEVVGALGLI